MTRTTTVQGLPCTRTASVYQTLTLVPQAYPLLRARLAVPDWEWKKTNRLRIISPSFLSRVDKICCRDTSIILAAMWNQKHFKTFRSTLQSNCLSRASLDSRHKHKLSLSLSLSVIAFFQKVNANNLNEIVERFVCQLTSVKSTEL